MSLQCPTWPSDSHNVTVEVPEIGFSSTQTFVAVCPTDPTVRYKAIRTATSTESQAAADAAALALAVADAEANIASRCPE